MYEVCRHIDDKPFIGLFLFLGADIKVGYLKLQKKTFLWDEEELTQEEYERLLDAAWKQGNERLCFALQTICATGIRVTELQHVTVESLARGCAVIENKGKIREILLGGDVVESLRGYTKKHGVKSGPVFVTKSGQPLHRGTIWAEMKALCESAGVDESKVYPHNLRRHFAVRFYATTGDFAKLADILGHSDHRTTRIYLRESGAEHRRLIDSLGLVKYRHVT